MSFIAPGIRDGLPGAELVSRRNKCVREIDTDHLCTIFGHFKSGAPDGTAKIKPALRRLIREVGWSAHRKVERIGHASWPGD